MSEIARWAPPAPPLLWLTSGMPSPEITPSSHSSMGLSSTMKDSLLSGTVRCVLAAVRNRGPARGHPPLLLDSFTLVLVSVQTSSVTPYARLTSVGKESGCAMA